MNTQEQQTMLALVARLVAENAELVAKNERLVADVKLMADATARRDVVIEKLRARGDYHKAQSAKNKALADDMDELYAETAENLAVEVEYKTGGFNDDGDYVWDLMKDDVEITYEDAPEAKPEEFWADGMKFLDAESRDEYITGRDIIDYGRNE